MHIFLASHDAMQYATVGKINNCMTQFYLRSDLRLWHITLVILVLCFRRNRDTKLRNVVFKEMSSAHCCLSHDDYQTLTHVWWFRQAKFLRKGLHFSSVVPAKNIARAKTFPVITNMLSYKSWRLHFSSKLTRKNEIDMTSNTDLSLPVS